VPPANDLCANASAIACGQTVTGSTVGATTAGDPTAFCGTDVDGGGVFYSIMGTGASITLSTCNPGTDFDTKLFVYSGSCGSYTCIDGNDDSSGCASSAAASSVTFNSVAGTTYLVFVSGYLDEAGTFALSATCTGLPVPAITSLSAASGPVGATVTLTGSGFDGASGVTFNGTPAVTYSVTNSTSLTVVVPAGATTGDVVVTTGGGASNGILFTVSTPTSTANAAKSEFSVWPNPVAGKGILNVRVAASAGKGHLTLRNALGQTIATRTFSGSTTELSTAGLASGTYLLTVQTDGRAPSIQRVVVE
jgi:hypothetical protein